MYYSNIGNEEIQHFHGTVGADFSTNLTDILTSNLFKVDTIIEDTLYRVYPLFYCKEIASSNELDKVSNTRCLILHKEEEETYYSFMTDETRSNVMLNESTLDLFDIGNSLTTDDYNAIIYRLRQTGSLTGSINFEESTSITGTYGTYIFNNVNGQLHNDRGLIINNQIKNNPITITLTNPFFMNARYTLTFTVRSLTGANVIDGTDTDYTTEDTFTVELIEDTEVNIDLSNYTNDSVLDYDIDITISFDVPELVNSSFNLSVTVDNTQITQGDDVTFTATSSSEESVAGYSVNFYAADNLLNTGTTDSDGVVTYTFTPDSSGTYLVKVLGLTSKVNIIVQPTEEE